MEVAKTSFLSASSYLNAAQSKSAVDAATASGKSAETGQKAQNDAQTKAACRDMEAMFLNIMMTQMRKTVQKSKLMDSSQEEMMTSMLDTEMTKTMASAGGIGLADMMYRQLTFAASGVRKPQAPK